MLPYTLNIRLSIRLRCIDDVVVVLCTFIYKKVLFYGPNKREIMRPFKMIRKISF